MPSIRERGAPCLGVIVPPPEWDCRRNVTSFHFRHRRRLGKTAHTAGSRFGNRVLVLISLWRVGFPPLSPTRQNLGLVHTQRFLSSDGRRREVLAVFIPTMTYENKIRFAIRLLQSIPTADGPIEISYSGGKDSDVILELARMAGIPFEVIYKQTTIDPPGTTRHAVENGATIIRPKKSFLQLVSEYGMPTRYYRFCCSRLKEYKIHSRAVQGIRRCESTKRLARYKEPEFCRTYSKTEKARIYLPILEWTDEDVERFVRERGIKCAPVYYTDGHFDVTKRLGCICCPLQSRKKLIEQYKMYPRFLLAEIKAIQRYIENKPESTAAKRFVNPWNQLFFHIFCDTMEEYGNLIGGGYSKRIGWIRKSSLRATLELT